jgi:FixJ family two-component response regulator
MTRGTVFLVDDDASVRKALQRLIQAAGFEVEAFADAASYLARSTPTPPACIVLDIRMPGMSGFQLQAELFRAGRALPIVFITGHGDEEVRLQALGSGAVDVLSKPIDEHVLVSAILKALASHAA